MSDLDLPHWWSAGIRKSCAESISLLLRCMARLEAQLAGVPSAPEAHRCIEELSQALGEPCNWLDARNAALAIHAGSLSLPIQVLIELKGRGQLGVLISSREAVGRGAPLTKSLLNQVLDHLGQLIPDAQLLYRSDRDGPLLHAGVAQPFA
jgi:hypothetical protein